MKIIEKLKDVLKQEDLKELNDQIKQMVNEEVEKRVAVIADEHKEKLDKLAEEYVEKAIAEEKKNLAEENKKELEEMEDRLIGWLDGFLDEEINEQISDEQLEKIAINETLEPIVKGIKKLFEENHIELDSEGSSLLKTKEDEIEDLKNENSSIMAKNIEYKEILEKVAIKKLIEEKTEGLSDEESKKVSVMAENVNSFDILKEKIDTIVDIVLEESNKSQKSDENDDPTPTNGGDGVKTKKNLHEDVTVSKLAQRFV